MAPVVLDLAQARETFSLYDRTGHGTIQADVVGAVVRSLGANPADTEVNALVEQYDPQASGLINFPEFLKIMRHFVTGAPMVDAETGRPLPPPRDRRREVSALTGWLQIGKV